MGSNKSKNTVQGLAVTDVMSRDWIPAFQMSLKQWRKSTMRFYLGFSTSVSHNMPSREYLTWQWSTQGRCLWARYETFRFFGYNFEMHRVHVEPLSMADPPTAQTFLNFMQFWGNFAKSYVDAPSSYGQSWIRP